MKAARKLFNEIVNDRDPRHFVESDKPLLVSFIMASLLANKTAESLAHIVEFEKAVRLQAMLSVKLRLNPHSRLDAKSATVKPMPPAPTPAPWESRYAEKNTR